MRSAVLFRLLFRYLGIVVAVPSAMMSVANRARRFRETFGHWGVKTGF